MYKKSCRLYTIVLLLIAGGASIGAVSLPLKSSTVPVCQSEEEVVLSLLHLNATLKQNKRECPYVRKICYLITNNPTMEHCQSDVDGMVSELNDLLKDIEKRNNHTDKEKKLLVSIRRFLRDCTSLTSKAHALGKTRIPCLSQLVVTSLEACDATVVGDLVVEGQIINPCCDGTSGGVTGATGPTGPTGATGADATSENYLFATYTSTGLYGTDGNLNVLTGTDTLRLAPDEQASVPLILEPSMTSGWTSSGGSDNGFIVPETGLYQISYELYALGIGNQYQINVASWVQLLGGSASQKLFGSQVSGISTYASISTQVGIPLSNTFFALLTVGDIIQLRALNQGVSSFVEIVIAATIDTSVAASLVITKIS